MEEDMPETEKKFFEVEKKWDKRFWKVIIILLILAVGVLVGMGLR